MTSEVQNILLAMIQKGGEAKEAYQKFNFDHYFRYLSFDEPQDYQKLAEKFKDNSEHLNFDMVENYFANNVVKFSFAPESDHHNNYKFAVLVPHTFIDKTGSTTETYETYSYSFTQNSKKADPPYFLQTYMSLEFSPVTMVITMENKPLAKFIISLCAIVGGVFVVFGILNSTVQSFKKNIRDD